MVLCVLPVGLSAESSGKIISQTTEYYEDGTYAVITVVETEPVTRASTKGGEKTHTEYNPDGSVAWEFTVYGTFSVDIGTSVTCTNSSYSVNIVSSEWRRVSSIAKRSGNQAIGDASFINGSGETRSCHVVLSCDKYGNLS